MSDTLKAWKGLAVRAFRTPRQFAAWHSENRWPYWGELVAYAGLIGAAAGMRLWDLGSRALHHDESLHAYFSWELSRGGSFEHNPMMHGPFQFHANAALFYLFGATDFTARILYVIAGVAIVAAPYLLRYRLGRIGALSAATMLAFSPSMLYFSRFARNDILMALLSLSLVAFMWRYLDSGKNRYLYGSAGLLALSFTSKESAYLMTGILSLFLIFLVGRDGWDRIRSRLGRGQLYGAPPGIVCGRILATGWSELLGGRMVSKASRPASYLVILGTLTLPLWSAFVGLLQPYGANLVLVAESGPRIGMPLGYGVIIAISVVVLLAIVAVYVGWRWSWGVWWRASLIFYIIFITFHTTFFTNCADIVNPDGFNRCFGGFGSGFWQGLGYWIVQQGEARGNQPAYYYFLVTSIYEFLPLLLSGLAVIYYWRRPDSFGRFLVYWALSSFILYTIASEKMPWLLVSIALPLILLAAKFLGDLVGRLQYKELRDPFALSVAAWVLLLGFVLWKLAFFGQGALDEPLWLLGSLLFGAVALICVGIYLRMKMAFATFAGMAVVGVVVVLLVMTIRTGARAAYQNGDIPVEMIVYTQTSPDIPQLSRLISKHASLDQQLSVTVDSSSGFQWPWAWYLRNIASVGYPNYEDSLPEEPPDTQILLVHANNKVTANPPWENKFGEGVRVKHRWWFPEQSYRGLTLGEFVRAFGDRDSWRDAMDYFMHRRVSFRLGSEDAIVFFADENLRDFTPASFP